VRDARSSILIRPSGTGQFRPLLYLAGLVLVVTGCRSEPARSTPQAPSSPVATEKATCFYAPPPRRATVCHLEPLAPVQARKVVLAYVDLADASELLELARSVPTVPSGLPRSCPSGAYEALTVTTGAAGATHTLSVGLDGCRAISLDDGIGRDGLSDQGGNLVRHLRALAKAAGLLTK